MALSSGLERKLARGSKSEVEGDHRPTDPGVLGGAQCHLLLRHLNGWGLEKSPGAFLSLSLATAQWVVQQGRGD